MADEDSAQIFTNISLKEVHELTDMCKIATYFETSQNALRYLLCLFFYGRRNLQVEVEYLILRISISSLDGLA
jgi:hypothetical protein